MPATRLAWKRRLGRGKRWLGRGGSAARAVVLLYHSVGATPLGLPREQFELQMQYLADSARVMSLEQLLTWSDEGKSGLACAITFDDGYLSVLDAASPVLSRRNFPATLYVLTGAVGDSQNPSSESFPGLYRGERMLNWQQVRELSRGGVTVGSHLQDHLDLTRIPIGQARSQMQDSKRTIEQRLGASCDHLAYPWGRANRAVAECARQSGYCTAVTGIHGAVARGADRQRIPRIDVRRDYSVEDFAAILRGDWDYLGLWQRARAWTS